MKAFDSSEEIKFLKENVVLNTGPQAFGVAVLHVNQTIHDNIKQKYQRRTGSCGSIQPYN